MRPLGLYLHIPFCRSKCLYCDFCSVPRPDAGVVDAYLARLEADLRAAARLCGDCTVDSVYFGGGTPTLLPPGRLAGLLSAVASAFRLSPQAEVTAECNPATGSREAFALLRRAGFNRLSIGLQSADAAELRALGRLHTWPDFLRTWEQARAAGFDNLSADVMFGIPHQTGQSFARTLEQVCALRPQHLSCYALTVEPGTPYGRRGEAALDLPDEERVRQMYLDAIAYLGAQGLAQYEISNFARPGYECRHNLKYWNAEEYLGFGPAAHSDFGGVRTANAADLPAYLAGSLPAARETPGREERMNEYVMLRMRLCAGLDTRAFAARFGTGAGRFCAALERYAAGGFVRRTASGPAFTPEGMLVSNTILSEVLDFNA